MESEEMAQAIVVAAMVVAAAVVVALVCWIAFRLGEPTPRPSGDGRPPSGPKRLLRWAWSWSLTKLVATIVAVAVFAAVGTYFVLDLAVDNADPFRLDSTTRNPNSGAATKVDWGALSAVSALAALFVSIVTASGIVFAVRDFEMRARQQRELERTKTVESAVTFGPYLRVDVAFRGEPSQAGFRPPIAFHAFDLHDLDWATEGTTSALAAQALAQLKQLSTANPTGWPLCLWVTNLQTHPLGFAYDLVLYVRIEWAAAGGQLEGIWPLRVELTYLGPRQTTALVLTRIPRTADVCEAEVFAVSYADRLKRRSEDVHGALALRYDKTKGARNVRKQVISDLVVKDGQHADNPPRAPWSVGS